MGEYIDMNHMWQDTTQTSFHTLSSLVTLAVDTSVLLLPSGDGLLPMEWVPASTQTHRRAAFSTSLGALEWP